MSPAAPQADYFYIVVGGRLSVLADDKQVNSLSSGECFGEMGILDDVPRNATVVAETHAACLALSAADLRLLLTKSSALRQGLRSIASGREENLRSRSYYGPRRATGAPVRFGDSD